MIILLNIFKTSLRFTIDLDIETEMQNREGLFCTNYPDMLFGISKFFETL